jgi:FkbM family methyltransferase
MIYVHIGAGAGDLDKGANLRDGFSEFVKQSKDNDKRIYVVEANPSNISKLEESWKNYKNVKIFNFAVSSSSYDEKKIKFYYSLDDAPHYQQFSNDIEHIKKYYKDLDRIKFKYIECVKINDFLNKNFDKKIINFFSIDIEGMDYDVIQDINLKKFEIINFSFEHLHLNFNQKVEIFKKFLKFNYSYNGSGIDHNNFDWTFKKKKNIWNNLIFFFIIFISKKHYKFLNKLLLKN